jgi:hypothetical protein
MSIDTEGSEPEVLAGFDFNTPVEIIGIENAYHGGAIRKVLKQNGYLLLTLARADEIYIKRKLFRFTGWQVYYLLTGIVKLAIRKLTGIKKTYFPKPWLKF